MPAKPAAGLLTAIALLLLVGAAGKSAQIPLYVWLPDAMAGPTPVSALIHAATMVTAGVYMVARSHVIFDARADRAGRGRDHRRCHRVLRRHHRPGADTTSRRCSPTRPSRSSATCSWPAACGAFSAGIFHLMTHAFFKALLFLGAGSRDSRASAASRTCATWAACGRRFPSRSGPCTAATLAISGIPPFAGFFSKDEILWQVCSSPHGGKVLLAHRPHHRRHDVLLHVPAVVYDFLYGELRLGKVDIGEEPHAAARSAHAGHGAAAHSHGRADDQTHGHGGVHDCCSVGDAGAFLSFWLLVRRSRLDRLARINSASQKTIRSLPCSLSSNPQPPPAPRAGHGAREVRPPANRRKKATRKSVGRIGPWRETSFTLRRYSDSFSLVLYFAANDPELPNHVAFRLLAAFTYSRSSTSCCTWTKAMDYSLCKPLLALSTIVFWRGVDQGIIDGLVNGAGSASKGIGNELRRMQSGNIRSYAAWVAIGGAAVLAYMIWWGVSK